MQTNQPNTEGEAGLAQAFESLSFKKQPHSAVASNAEPMVKQEPASPIAEPKVKEEPGSEGGSSLEGSSTSSEAPTIIDLKPPGFGEISMSPEPHTPSRDREPPIEPRPSYYIVTPVYIVSGREIPIFGQPQTARSVIITPVDDTLPPLPQDDTSFFNSSIETVRPTTTGPAEMDTSVPPIDDPEDMSLVEPSFDVTMESAPDDFTPRPSDPMSICKDSKIEATVFPTRASQRQSDPKIKLEDVEDSKQDIQSGEEKKEDSPDNDDQATASNTNDDDAIFGPVPIRDYAQSTAKNKRFADDALTLGLRNRVYRSWLVNEYDNDWMTKEGVSEAVLDTFESALKLESLVDKKALKMGDEIYIKFNIRQGGQERTVEKSGTVIDFHNRDRGKGSYLPELRVFVDGVEAETVAGCNGVTGVLDAFSKHGPVMGSVKGWKQLRVRRGDKELGSLFDIRQIYHLYQAEKTAWLDHQGMHVPRRRVVSRQTTQDNE